MNSHQSQSSGLLALCVTLLLILTAFAFYFAASPFVRDYMEFERNVSICTTNTGDRAQCERLMTVRENLKRQGF